MKLWHWIVIAAVVTVIAYFLFFRSKASSIVTPVHVPSANLSLPIGAVTVPPNNGIAISGRMHF